MRVLVLTSMYPPHHLGGYELSCRDTMRRWVAAGHEVRVLASTYRAPRPTGPDDDDIPVARELEWYWHDAAFVRPPALRRFAMERRNQQRLHRELDAWRPTVVSVWQMGGMSLSLLSTLADGGLPLVYVVSDEWLGYAPKVDAWTSAWRVRPTLGTTVARLTGVPTGVPDLASTGTFCFISDWLRRRAELAISATFPRCHVTPAGIDTVDFPTLEPRPARPWSGQLLCVGRSEPRKGFQTAVEALAQLPDARLIIDGPSEAGYDRELRALAVSLGVADRVEQTTSARGELATRYQAADVVLFTSMWDEPFGLVPLEAMACGTPVIATGTGGSAEFLSDEQNCVLVAPGDVAALVAAVRRLAADEPLRATVQAGGARTSRRYSADAYAATLASIHAEVAA